MTAPTLTLADLSRTLNRPVVVITSLQHRFELPSFGGAGYSNAYLALLRTLFSLRALAISEDRLLDLWHLEKKLLQLIHVDSTGSKTWFLDSCGRTDHIQRRLLLTNYDIGIAIPAQAIQLGLDFNQRPPELFAGTEMGEDASRILNKIIPIKAAICADVAVELPHLRETAKWAARLS
jgi:hypothetical protein